MEMRTTRRPTRPSGAKRRLLAGFLSIILSLVEWNGGLFQPAQPIMSAGLSPTVRPPSPTSAPVPVPERLALAPPPHDDIAQLAAYVVAAAPSRRAASTVIERTIKKGDTAISIFRSVGVDGAQAMQLHRAVRPVYNLSHLRIGQSYRIEVSPQGQVKSFNYVIDGRRQLDVVRSNRKFVGRIVSIPYARRQRVVAGRIHSSMYASLRAQGERTRLIHDFAEIFAWSIDFATDLRKGDTYRLLIEERAHNGNAPKTTGFWLQSWSTESAPYERCTTTMMTSRVITVLTDVP